MAGSSYGIAYGHFRRDHSDPLNVWLHVGCLFLQIFGNFALLDCLDRTLGTRSVAPFTAAAWALALGRTPSPPSVRAFTIALLAVASRGCAALAPSDPLCVAHAPHGPARADLLLALPAGPQSQAARGAVVLRRARRADGVLPIPPRPCGFVGCRAGGRSSRSRRIPNAVGSLVRSRNNLPLVSQFGSALWVPALLLDQPWVYFLSLSFMGAGLQGVAHELTSPKGDAQSADGRGLRSARAHTSFFPVLTLQVSFL